MKIFNLQQAGWVSLLQVLGIDFCDKSIKIAPTCDYLIYHRLTILYFFLLAVICLIPLFQCVIFRLRCAFFVM